MYKSTQKENPLVINKTYKNGNKPLNDSVNRDHLDHLLALPLVNLSSSHPSPASLTDFGMVSIDSDYDLGFIC